jgi:hypothetical protein
MYLCARGMDSVQSLDSEWRCTCVRGVWILYKAWIVSDDVLVCEGYGFAHKYITTHYPGFVQNRYPSHTSTSPLTIQALYRIDTPRTQVHRHSLSRLCTESIPLDVGARGIDSIQSLDSEWRCTCVRGVSILYKAWIVSGDVLV